MGTTKKVLTIKIIDFWTGEVAEYNNGEFGGATNKFKVQTMAKVLKRWMKTNKELGNEGIVFKVESNSKKAKLALENFIKKEAPKAGLPLVELVDESENGLAIKALEKVTSSGVENEKYFEKFCEELEKLGVNENKFDYSGLFEVALSEKELI